MHRNLFVVKNLIGKRLNMKMFQFFLFFLCVFTTQVFSQTFLNIKRNDGPGQYSTTDALRKLTFNAAGDSVKITLKTGGVISDPISAIQRFTFDNSGSGVLLPVENAYSQTAKKYDLSQNFPNPFNPTTAIMYAVPEKGFVSLKVYDILGNTIATLVNEEKPAGQYTKQFDAHTIASGVYFYKLTVGGVSISKKMSVIK